MFSPEVSTEFYAGTSPANNQRWHKQYAKVGQDSVAALERYKEQVQGKTFPAAENVSEKPPRFPQDKAKRSSLQSYEMKPGELERLDHLLH